MSKLVKIDDGTWVDPNEVVYVAPVNEEETLPSLSMVGVGVKKPKTVVRMRHGASLSWDYQTMTGAAEKADKIAAIINGDET